MAIEVMDKKCQTCMVAVAICQTFCGDDFGWEGEVRRPKQKKVTEQDLASDSDSDELGLNDSDFK